MWFSVLLQKDRRGMRKPGPAAKPHRLRQTPAGGLLWIAPERAGARQVCRGRDKGRHHAAGPKAGRAAHPVFRSAAAGRRLTAAMASGGNFGSRRSV